MDSLVQSKAERLAQTLCRSEVESAQALAAQRLMEMQQSWDQRYQDAKHNVTVAQAAAAAAEAAKQQLMAQVAVLEAREKDKEQEVVAAAEWKEATQRSVAHERTSQEARLQTLEKELSMSRSEAAGAQAGIAQLQFATSQTELAQSQKLQYESQLLKSETASAQVASSSAFVLCCWLCVILFLSG